MQKEVSVREIERNREGKKERVYGGKKERECMVERKRETVYGGKIVRGSAH